MTNEQLKSTTQGRAPLSSGRVFKPGSSWRARLGRRVQPEELSVSDDCTSLAEYLEKFFASGSVYYG